MPLPFEDFEAKGILGFLDSSDYKIHGRRRRREEEGCFVVNNNGGFSEPTSVLDSIRRSPSPLVSSSTTTLSSSHGGGLAAAFPAADGKYDQMCFEDLDGVILSASPGQEQSILKLIMSSGGVMDPGSDFACFDTGLGSDPVIDNQNPIFDYTFPFSEPPPPEVEEKFQIPTGFSSPPPAKRFNSGQPDSNHYNPGFFSVAGSPPPSKRLNSGQPGSHQWIFPFSDPGHESHGDPFLPPPKTAVKIEDDHDHDQSSTVIIDQLFNAAVELIGTTTTTTTVHGGDNNPILAQEILARLNHSLNPKTPFHRAALYITEALQSLLLLQNSPPSPQQTLIFKIAGYRAFSETSPFLQFVNFTANQTILESLDRFDRIHIVDFDIGYGGQWSSLIQELAGGKVRNRALSLKITSFVSPATVSDEFELRFTEENLKTFAGEVGVMFEIEFLNVETLLDQTYWPVSLLRSSEKEGIAVNLPISSVVSGYLPLILRFLKELSPNVFVCSDRSCDRNNDAPFPNGVIHALQYYTSLLESFGNQNHQEVERFYVQPSIQRLLTNRYRWMERSPPWRSLFGQCGFTPVMLSQTAETQAEYLMERNPMSGFHLEKRQSSSSLSSSSLVLFWQKKELVAVSAWKCC